MNKTKEYLITLMRAYLNGEETVPRSDIDYGELFALSAAHNLSAVIFCPIKNSADTSAVPKAIWDKFSDSFLDAVFRHEIQSTVTEKIGELFTANGIPHCFFKGVSLSKLYPVPETRVMGDIDVIIAPEYRQRAQKLLIDDGARLTAPNGYVQEYMYGGTKTELHTKIISDKFGCHNLDNAFSDVFDNICYNGCVGKMDDDYHFAYLIAHIAHHFWFYGAGAKMILDLAVILKEKNINLGKVFHILDRAKLTDFGKIILTVCYRWFALGVDYGTDCAETEEFLLSYGAFGNLNRNKAAVVERKQLEEGNYQLKHSRLKLMFPPYKKMKELPYIKFINGQPWLLPAAWVYRLLYYLKHRREMLVRTVSDMNKKQTKQQAREELQYFENIGLL